MHDLQEQVPFLSLSRQHVAVCTLSSSCSQSSFSLCSSSALLLPHLSAGASLPPVTHTIPLSQLQGQPVALQGSGPPGPTATLHASATQPTTLLRLPATVSLAGQHTATPTIMILKLNRSSSHGNGRPHLTVFHQTRVQLRSGLSWSIGHIYVFFSDEGSGHKRINWTERSEPVRLWVRKMLWTQGCPSVGGASYIVC